MAKRKDKGSRNGVSGVTTGQPSTSAVSGVSLTGAEEEGRPVTSGVSLGSGTPAQPQQPPPHPTVRLHDPPWGREAVTTEWVLHAQDGKGKPHHPFVLLGEQVLESHESYQQLMEACQGFLQHRVRRRNDPVAKKILADTRMKTCAKLDERGWKKECERYDQERPEWYDLERVLQMELADNKLSSANQRKIRPMLDRYGESWDWLLDHVKVHYPNVTVGDIAVRGIFEGEVITSEQHFMDLATASWGRSREALEKLELLRFALRQVPSDAATSFGNTIDEADKAASTFNNKHGLGLGKEDQGRFKLWCIFWSVGQTGLRLPELYNGPWYRDPDDMLTRLDGDPGPLRRAIETGLLAFWLSQAHNLKEPAKRLLRRKSEPEAAGLDLLWALGEERILLGGMAAHDEDSLITVLKGSPPKKVAAEYERKLKSGLLAEWAKARGLSRVRTAAGRAKQHSGDLARKVLLWNLGQTELKPGVNDANDFADLVAQNRERAIKLVANGEVNLWATGLGLLPKTYERKPGWSWDLTLHKLLWALGVHDLIISGVRFATPTELLTHAKTRSSAALELTAGLEQLADNNVLSAWYKHHTGAYPPQKIKSNQSLARAVLWHQGFTAFPHAACGLQRTPKALGTWGDNHQQVFGELLKSGLVQEWLGFVSPALEPELGTALEHRDVVEKSCQVLGLDRPALSHDPTQINFGAVPEGGTASSTITVKNEGPRGLARVTLDLQTKSRTSSGLEHIQIDWEPFALRAGEQRTITVQVTPPRGESQNLDAQIMLDLDGQPGTVDLHYHTTFNIGLVVKAMSIGAVLGVVGFATWRAMLYALAGPAVMAADGGYITDIAIAVMGGHADTLGVIIKVALLGVLPGLAAIIIGRVRAK
jgi:hypothetical protein